MAATNKGRLQGEVAIITGAANGCGRAAVEIFLQEGARVVGVDKDLEGGRVLEDRLRNPNFRFVNANVAIADDVKRAIRITLDAFGQIDTLFNQAGEIIVQPVLEASESDFDMIMDNNVRSVFLMTQAVLPSMLRQGRGSIITTSSVSATTATPMESLYCASKAAVSQFTRAVAVEFRDKGIRANVLHPGFVRTRHGTQEMARLRELDVGASDADIAAMQGRICEPDEIARVAVFLASQDASFINGAQIAVDNTFTAI